MKKTNIQYGLSKKYRKQADAPKMTNQDVEFIEHLKSLTKHPDATKANEAKEALKFLNAYNMAEYDGKFSPLESITEVDKQFKKEINAARYSAKKDISNSKLQSELKDTIPDSHNLGELIDQNKVKQKRSRK